MNKKFLSLVLALVMVLGTFGNVFAAAAPEKKEVKEVPKLTTTEAKVQWLIDNKIVVGIADKDGKAIGDMDLKSPIRRDAVAKMIVYAIGEKDLADKLQGVYRPFPDVETSNIMNGLITVAASKTNVNGVPIIVGYEDGMFRPTNNVTYAELAKMLVVAIDKDLTPAKAASYSWPQGWLNRAAQLGIFDGLSIDKANAPAVRSDAFAMVYNAFAHLKELKAVPANEFRGVISERSDGTTLVLNQGDFKKEFKVTKDTVFVNQAKVAQKWLYNKAAENNYYVGSVVRVLFDKDGVVTHIIEMGNPVVGVKNANVAWVDLGNKTLKLAESNWNAAANDVKLNKSDVTFDGKAYELNSKTEFYVADPDNGVLTKVKDYAAAKALVADKNGMTSKVYLAFEKLPASGVREARVVVFNHAEIEANARLVRVQKVVSNPDYLLSVNAPGETETAIEQFSTRYNGSVWPYNYGVVANDVIKLVVNGENVKGIPAKVIDYEKDNIYKIVDFKLIEGTEKKSVDRAQANAIVLADREGFEATFDLSKDYDKFFGNQLVKGAHVQIATRSAGNIIDVISVVNHDLRGHIPNGVDTELVKGTVANVIPAIKKGELNRVLIIEEGNKKPTPFVTALPVADFKVGSYVELRVGDINNTYSKHEILEIVKQDVDRIVGDLLAKINYVEQEKELTKDGKTTKVKATVVEASEANKAALEAAVAAYNETYGAAPKAKDTNGIKELINYLIDSYNNADADAANDIAPIA